jgi:hypothetical protein
MYRYLTDKVADYTTQTFTFTPNNVMMVISSKHQILREYDDKQVSVANISNPSKFTIQLQWSDATETVQQGIFDWWHDPLIANGRARTFYWLNPVDEREYTVRFLTRLTTNYSPYARIDISSVNIFVEGNKPA